MNDLKYDVMTIGNHEFDNGIDDLASFVSSLNFPVVTSNINLDAENLVTKPLRDAGVKPYVILKKYNLGIIGFITNNTASIIADGEKLRT
jgi:2',3'-cyclic-nucleotide 2'-phosphodiesterase (5'-nucleotidase family)